MAKDKDPPTPPAERFLRWEPGQAGRGRRQEHGTTLPNKKPGKPVPKAPPKKK